MNRHEQLEELEEKKEFGKPKALKQALRDHRSKVRFFDAHGASSGISATQLEASKKELLNRMESLTYNELKAITLYYFEGYDTWYDVEYEMIYSLRQIKYFHEQALGKEKELEQSIADGMVIELPCKVGDKVFHLMPHVDGILEDTVRSICDVLVDRGHVLQINDYGKTWFLTKPEAEQALKEMGE